MAPFLEISTRDPERALPTLEEYFPGVRMSNPHGNFALQLIAAEVETFSIIRYRLQAPASSSSADFSDSLSFGHVDVGAMGLVTVNDTIDTTQSWRFPEERVHADWDDVTITALTISKSAALQMARAQVGSDSSNLAFIGTAPIDRSRGRQWNAFVDYTHTAMTSDISALDSPLVRTSAFAHLMSLLLDTFPSTMMDSARQGSRPTTAPSAVRRAQAFIEQNAHLPITVEDIARESRVSIRALQYAFQRHIGTTPVAYLRRARLDGAHRDLLHADSSNGATVLAIALEWGFAHPGRFATYYREAYGVSPKHTLDS